MSRADVVGSWRRCHDRGRRLQLGRVRKPRPARRSAQSRIVRPPRAPSRRPRHRPRTACPISAPRAESVPHRRAVPPRDRRLLPAVDRVRRCPELLPTELYLDDGWTCQVSPPGLPFRPPRKHPHRVLPHRVLDGEGHLPTAVAPSDPKEQQRAVHQAGDWRTEDASDDAVDRRRATCILRIHDAVLHRSLRWIEGRPGCRLLQPATQAPQLGPSPLATATSSPRPLTTCEPGTHRRVPILEIRPVGNQPTARDPPPHKHIRRRLTLGGRADLLHHQQHRIASTSASRSGGRRSTAIRLPGRGWMASSNPVSTITGLSSDR